MIVEDSGDNSSVATQQKNEAPQKQNDDKKQEKGEFLLKTIKSVLAEINNQANVRYINQDNYDKLGRFHKQLVSNFGKMLNLVNKNQEVDYDEFVQVFEKLFENKTDIEKQYLWGLFFPETIKHATFLNPFPVPVYSYKQTYTFHITPNSSGNFVLQMVTPYMVEKGSTLSDVYYINDDALDGYTTAPLPLNYVAESRVPAGVFQAFVMVAASVKVSYLGRVDVSSGYFGGSYHLSTTDVADFDSNVQGFNYVDNSFNSVRTKLFTGASLVYFPQDSSFQTFKKPNANSATNYIAMNHRLNVYGRGLPSGTLSPKSVMVTITKVYATLPKSGYEEIMGVHAAVNELSSDQLEEAHNFIKESGLSVRDSEDDKLVEKILKMPQFDRNDIINEVGDKYQNHRREAVLSKLKGYKDIKTKIRINN